MMARRQSTVRCGREKRVCIVFGALMGEYMEIEHGGMKSSQHDLS